MPHTDYQTIILMTIVSETIRSRKHKSNSGSTE